MRTPAFLAVSALLLLVPGRVAPAEEPSGPGAAWTAAVAVETGARLSGCAIGDLDPTNPGNEIAAVAESGDVFVVRRSEDGWKGERIATLPGAAIQCAIGDADPTREGDELIVVGMLQGGESASGKGAAHVVRAEGGSWKVEKVAEDSALIHGAAIGDFDPRHPGTEVLTVGFSGSARVYGTAEGGWALLGQAPLGGPGKMAIPWHGGAAVACVAPQAVWVLGEEIAFFKDGDPDVTYEVRYVATTMDVGAAAQARVGTDGERLLFACDDGGLRLVDGKSVTVIHQEAQKLRGAVLADLDPSREGLEAATTGYGKALTLLYPPAAAGGSWTPVVPWRDEAALHHLAAGDVDERTPGPELVAVGFGGRVIVAAHRPGGLRSQAPDQSPGVR